MCVSVDLCFLFALFSFLSSFLSLQTHAHILYLLLPSPHASHAPSPIGKGRPQRTRVPPTAYWKGERVVYEPVVSKGRKTGLVQVKEVVHVDSPQEFKRKKGKRAAAAGGRKRSTRAKTRGGEAHSEDEGGDTAGSKARVRTRVVEKIVTKQPEPVSCAQVHVLPCV